MDYVVDGIENGGFGWEGDVAFVGFIKTRVGHLHFIVGVIEYIPFCVCFKSNDFLSKIIQLLMCTKPSCENPILTLNQFYLD